MEMIYFQYWQQIHLLLCMWRSYSYNSSKIAILYMFLGGDQ